MILKLLFLWFYESDFKRGVTNLEFRLVENTTGNTLLVFVPQISPRVEYIFNFLITKILGSEVIFTLEQEEFLSSNFPKINYSFNNFGTGLFLKAHKILFENTIQIQEIDHVEYQGLNLFFSTDPNSFLPFDPFASAFYLITRYEEYNPGKRDEHDRFPDSDNLLVKNELHEKPVVDYMAYWIAGTITAIFPEFKPRKRSFQFLTTIDIDNAWAYKNKSILIVAGGAIKAAIQGRWKEVVERLAVSMGLKSDPYDTYQYILKTYKELLNHILFFFLIGDRSNFDKNVSYKNKKYRELISGISSVCEVGIHPSYASNQNSRMVDEEIIRLENIIQKPVRKSRQHYLKLEFPGTYNKLAKSGITDDYTMGFASLAGFRAGTCTVFPFFDLSKNQSSDLMIHPFQLMDVALANYMHLNPEAAGELCQNLMKEVKKVDGTFISLWHNESLNDKGKWQGWQKIFEQIQQTGLNYSYD